MRKYTFLSLLLLLSLAQPASAMGPAGNRMEMEDEKPLPVIERTYDAADPANRVQTQQRLYIEGEPPATAQQLRDQIHDRQDVMMKNLDETMMYRQEVSNRVEDRRMDLQQELEQRREEIRERIATRSPQLRLNASDHMSTVAQHIQELHDLADKQKAIGPEIREIAQAQQDSQASTAAQLRRMDNRSRLMKFFFGQDEDAVSQLSSLETANEERIIRLQTVLDQTDDEDAKIVIENTIDSLEEQNLLIAQQIELGDESFSIFGFIRQIFNR